MFSNKIRKIISKFIFKIFNFKKIKIVNLNKKNRDLYDNSDYKQKKLKFNLRRQIKNYNFISRHFKKKLFKNKKILELGPGSYAFSLTAKNMGAEVHVVEKIENFCQIGKNLKFKVYCNDFNKNLEFLKTNFYDGIFIKGTFGSKARDSFDNYKKKIYNLLSKLKNNGWIFYSPWNDFDDFDTNTKNKKYEEQKKFLISIGLNYHEYDETFKKRYCLNYKGSKYIYTKNLNL